MRAQMTDAQPGQTNREGATTPQQIYQERCARFAQQRDYYNRRSYRNADLNIALIVAALACLGLWLWRDNPALLIASGLFGVAFIAAFVHHGRVDRLQRYYQVLWTINDLGLRRLRRDWAGLPLSQPAKLDVNHPYAADLDLTGHASLEHLLGTPQTPVGRATLRDWLLQPAPPAVVRARQAAVAELAPLIDFRDQLALRGHLISGAQPHYERFLDWAESPSWLARRPWLVVLARILPVVAIVLLLAQLFGLTNYPIWLICIAANLTLIVTIVRQIGPIIETVAERQIVFRSYADLFRLIASQPFAASTLQDLQHELSAGGISADEQMRRLSKLMPLADLRQWMFFFPIQIFTLWDVHLLWLLERWRRRAGHRARAWLAACGDIEALTALATLAYDNPTWTFPTIVEGQTPLFNGRNLGHPLIPDSTRIANDVTIGPPGTFLLVTGSNMSGKSTLLRAIGVNVVLAQAGGPVCASLLELPPLALATSMRIQDSLSQGVSYFMAELQRLKQVVDLAHLSRNAGERTLLFLLDEILHGTNTDERQVAARHIIRHLLAQAATGVVSTHDLTLAQAPDISHAAQLVHFTEIFERGPDGLLMQFDYKLRPGLATSTNALKLMEIVGLPVE